MDCENCRHLTVVGLQDTGPRCVVCALFAPFQCHPATFCMAVCRVLSLSWVCHSVHRWDIKQLPNNSCSRVQQDSPGAGEDVCSVVCGVCLVRGVSLICGVCLCQLCATCPMCDVWCVLDVWCVPVPIVCRAAGVWCLFDVWCVPVPIVCHMPGVWCVPCARYGVCRVPGVVHTLRQVCDVCFMPGVCPVPGVWCTPCAKCVMCALCTVCGVCHVPDVVCAQCVVCARNLVRGVCPPVVWCVHCARLGVCTVPGVVSARCPSGVYLVSGWCVDFVSYMAREFSGNCL